MWILKETVATPGFEELCPPILVKKELPVETNEVVIATESAQQVNHGTQKILAMRYDVHVEDDQSRT